jgi:hypothetical protein
MRRLVVIILAGLLVALAAQPAAAATTDPKLVAVHHDGNIRVPWLHDPTSERVIQTMHLPVGNWMLFATGAMNNSCCSGVYDGDADVTCTLKLGSVTDTITLAWTEVEFRLKLASHVGSPLNAVLKCWELWDPAPGGDTYVSSVRLSALRVGSMTTVSNSGIRTVGSGAPAVFRVSDFHPNHYAGGSPVVESVGFPQGRWWLDQALRGDGYGGDLVTTSCALEANGLIPDESSSGPAVRVDDVVQGVSTIGNEDGPGMQCSVDNPADISQIVFTGLKIGKVTYVEPGIVPDQQGSGAPRIYSFTESDNTAIPAYTDFSPPKVQSFVLPAGRWWVVGTLWLEQAKGTNDIDCQLQDGGSADFRSIWMRGANQQATMQMQTTVDSAGASTSINVRCGKSVAGDNPVGQSVVEWTQIIALKLGNLTDSAV